MAMVIGKLFNRETLGNIVILEQERQYSFQTHLIKWFILSAINGCHRDELLMTFKLKTIT